MTVKFRSVILLKVYQVCYLLTSYILQFVSPFFACKSLKTCNRIKGEFFITYYKYSIIYLISEEYYYRLKV